MPTKLIRSIQNLPASAQGGVVTIGNFDGVHLGHQALLAELVKEAKARSVSSTVITFEPHPFEFFAGDKLTIPRITRLREKVVQLAKNGVDHVLIIEFNHRFAELPARDFIKLLQQTLSPNHIVIGDDFRFGKGREGDYQLLEVLAKEDNFTLAAMPTFELQDDRVSSTRVRKALKDDDLNLANQLLGRSYTMLGRVRHGNALGTQLGFPTANIHLHRRLTPIHGIFTVYVHGLDEKPLPGVANIGTRPTVGGTRTLLEVHLLDFNENIYGRYVEVEFCKKLREEERYPSLELLKEQIARDVVAARQYFEGEK